MNKKLLQLFILLIAIQLSVCVLELNSKNQVGIFYEDYSFMPMVHIYYNRHFSKSKQFDNFLDVVEEVQYITKDYATIVFTNCDQVKDQVKGKGAKINGQEQLQPCTSIKRLNQNRMILGYIPSQQFTKFGTIVMQSPPRSRVFDHYSDVYTVQQIKNFIDSLTLSFYKQLTNIQMFQQFKKPRYVPKLVYATRQDDVPSILKQLGIAFFLKFDLAYVSDLTESIVNQLQISSFPTLLIMKYNYSTQKLQVIKYQGNDFSEDQYGKVKKFLSQYALPQKRNDYLFHLIKRPTQSDILTVDNIPDFDNSLDKANGWVMVAEGKSAQQLYTNKQKFGLFFQYIHFLKPEETTDRLFLYNPRSNLKYEFNDKLQYRLMNSQDFHSNATIWLSKDLVVMGVRQQYAHMCAISQKFLFKGLTQCFVIEEDSYQKVAQMLGLKFTYGFVCSNKKAQSSIKGHELRSTNFAEVYEVLEYSTRHKVKQIIDDFIDNPVQEIKKSMKLVQLCAQPLKKCIFYFSQPSKKDNTKKQYLQQEAVQYANQYKFFQIDMSCNQHFYDEIISLQSKAGGLIAYHPKLDKYVLLKAKMTKGVIQKFLKINNSQQRSLPFKQFLDNKIQIYSCSQKKEADKQNKENKAKQVPIQNEEEVEEEEEIKFDEDIQL